MSLNYWTSFSIVIDIFNVWIFFVKPQMFYLENSLSSPIPFLAIVDLFLLPINIPSGLAVFRSNNLKQCHHVAPGTSFSHDVVFTLFFVNLKHHQELSCNLQSILDSNIPFLSCYLYS